MVKLCDMRGGYHLMIKSISFRSLSLRHLTLTKLLEYPCSTMYYISERSLTYAGFFFMR